MTNVLKGKDIKEKTKYFEKVKKIRDGLHHANADFILGIDKRKFNFEIDKRIIDKIENHLKKSETLISDLLHRMIEDLK